MQLTAARVELWNHCANVRSRPPQHLDLRHNPDLESFPITAARSATSRLQCLALDARPALRLLGQPLGLTALARLVVDCTSVWLAEAEVLALLDAVGRLPQLHTLKVRGGDRDMLSRSNAVAEASRSLAQQRPCLRLVLDLTDERPHDWAN